MSADVLSLPIWIWGPGVVLLLVFGWGYSTGRRNASGRSLRIEQDPPEDQSGGGLLVLAFIVFVVFAGVAIFR